MPQPVQLILQQVLRVLIQLLIVSLLEHVVTLQQLRLQLLLYQLQQFLMQVLHIVQQVLQLLLRQELQEDYTAPAGVIINAATGAINLATSTPGTYTITYSFTAGACSNTATTSITITALPTATISYAGSPYCATGTATVTQTGTAGGTYTAPAGVIINAATGAINLATSTPGTYTITYRLLLELAVTLQQQVSQLLLSQLLQFLMQDHHIVQQVQLLLHRLELLVEPILHLQEL